MKALLDAIDRDFFDKLLEYRDKLDIYLSTPVVIEIRLFDLIS